ncbi:hypothetical protein JTB14_018670 [Gonioctena quinquepunctata]|nr:hypothetical protein JTB14_018670 [Gonioctena quinquepunctata]
MEPRGGASQGENLRPRFYNLSRPNECYGAASGANFGPPASDEIGQGRTPTSGTNNVNQNGSFVVLDPEIQQNYWRPEVRANRQVTFSTNELFNSTLENNSPPTRQNAHSRDSEKIPSNFPNETDPINLLASLLAQSLSSNKRIDKQRLPTFPGVDTEDPRLFLRKLTRELQKFSIPIDEWVNFITGQLRGEALQWSSLYSGLYTNWGFFENRFYNKYDNSWIKSKLISKLYGQAQGKSEKVDLFIGTKLALANRLIPDIREHDLVNIIIELLLPRIKVCLRGLYIFDIETLCRFCNEIEADLNAANSNPQPRNEETGRKNNVYNERTSFVNNARNDRPYRAPPFQNNNDRPSYRPSQNVNYQYRPQNTNRNNSDNNRNFSNQDRNNQESNSNARPSFQQETREPSANRSLSRGNHRHSGN